MINRREFFEALTAAGIVITSSGAKGRPWSESEPITEPDPPYLDTLIAGRTAPEVCNIYVQSLEPPSEWILIYLGTAGDFGPLSIAQAFGGILPKRWRLSMRPSPLPVAAVPVDSEYVGDDYRTMKFVPGKPFIILPIGGEEEQNGE